MQRDDARVARLRRVAKQKIIQAEAAHQQSDEEFHAMRAQRQRAAECDAALAAELAEEQRRKTLEEKMLLRAREFPEVRELEHALKEAYLYKGRAEQMADQSQAKAQAAQEQRDYLNMLIEKDRRAEEEENHRRIEEVQRFREYQQHQLRIIEERRAAAAQQAEVRQRERVAVDAVVARLQEKDFLNALDQHERQRKLQQEQEDFRRIRAELKKAEQEREAKEECAIRAYLAEQAQRKEKEDNTARDRDMVKMRILEEQSRMIMEEQRKKVELENLLYEYYEEERLAKEAALLKAQKESHERMSAAIMQENANLLEQRREAQRKESAENLEYRQRMMDQINADKKLQQLSLQRQLQLRRGHLAEAECALETRRKMKEEERRMEKKVEDLDRKHEEELQEYIRKARIQLLQQHVPKLGNFTPMQFLKENEKKLFSHANDDA